jgi:hypothetical protein
MRDKIIRLRVQTCGNGDECPALDRREEGWIEVTGELVDRPGLAPGERTIRVPDTLLPEIVALDVNLGTFIAQHHHTDLPRVQTLTHYEVASDDEDYHRYLDGAATPTATGKGEWLDRLRTDTAAGRLRRNVHIVRTPLTPYLRYQFEWCYLPNTSAGQDIRVLDAAEIPAAAALLPVGDLAIIEGRHVAQLRYSPAASTKAPWRSVPTPPAATWHSRKSRGSWPPRSRPGGLPTRSTIATTLRPGLVTASLVADRKRGPWGADPADVTSCPARYGNSGKRPTCPPGTPLDEPVSPPRRSPGWSEASTYLPRPT